jgi:hypothetical protein
MQSNKQNFGTVAADVIVSKCVNANERLESGNESLTIKYSYRVGQPRTLVFGAFAILFLAVASILLFYGCKKDGDNIVKQHKMLEGNELKEFEKYTPNQETLGEKLLMFTNYVNNNDVLMPNMELKEAIWFMETFFNIGVCEKQRQFVAYTHSKKTYLLTVPTYEQNDNGIILNGEVLQASYRDVLVQIVSEICPEYSLNFGDVYVHQISADGVVLGITVLYGTKAEQAYSTIGRKRVNSPGKPAAYPNGTVPPYGYDKFSPNGKGPDLWVLKSGWNHGIHSCGGLSYLRETYMETALNREFIFMFLTNIELHGATTTSLNYDCPSAYQVYDNWNNATTPALTKAEYQHYGQIYLDFIHTKCWNTVPADYSPLWGCCFYLTDLVVSSYAPGTIILYHRFGLEYICKFVPTVPGEYDGLYAVHERVVYDKYPGYIACL